MQELRQDPVTGRWVVIAPIRGKRPKEYEQTPKPLPSITAEECPFCPGNEHLTPPEVYAVRDVDSEPDKPGWQIRVVPNKFPAFSQNPSPLNDSHSFIKRAAFGYHEVVIHSPRHDEEISAMPVERLVKLIEVYKLRCVQIGSDPNIKYVHIIVNHGVESGASLEHAHSQIFGLPLVPEGLQDELGGSLWFSQSKERCVFCWMLEEEMKTGQRVLFENTHFLAVAPFASRFPFEIWLLPKRHSPSFETVKQGEIGDLAHTISKVISAYNCKLGNPSYNFFIHTAPCDGSDYHYFHWHAEVFPRISSLGAFELGTQIMINPTAPERAVELLS